MRRRKHTEELADDRRGTADGNNVFRSRFRSHFQILTRENCFPVLFGKKENEEAEGEWKRENEMK